MDNTKVQVFLLPSDCGNRSVRMGAGPEHFVNNGLASVLESNGQEVSLESIELRAEIWAEAQTQLELYRILAVRVSQSRRDNTFPLILSGSSPEKMLEITANLAYGLHAVLGHLSQALHCLSPDAGVRAHAVLGNGSIIICFSKTLIGEDC